MLRGQAPVQLRRDVRPAKTRKPRGKQAVTIEDRDVPLWEALRQRRKEIAESQGVPPYVIFHDSTLAQMMELRPDDREAFSGLSGVGERKLLLYADPFLEVLRDHPHAADGAASRSNDPGGTDPGRTLRR